MQNITTVVEKQNEFGQLKKEALRLVNFNEDTAHTLTCWKGALHINHCNLVIVIDDNGEPIGIRSLTSLECWRLMGFNDTDYLKAQKVCPDEQLIKQAGNSIVVNVLEEIFKQLIGE